MGDQTNIIVGAAALSIAGVDVGYTQGGVTLRKQRQYVDVDADQLGGVARKVATFERMFLTTTVLEATLLNIQKAMSEPDANKYGGTALSMGVSTPATVEYLVTVTGKAPGTKTTRTYTFYRAILVDEVSHLIGSREAASTIPFGFELLKDDTKGGHFGVFADT